MRIANKLTCKREGLNMKYIFILLALISTHVNSMSKLTSLRKAATASYHTCAKLDSDWAPKFELLKHKHLTNIDTKIERLLIDASIKKTSSVFSRLSGSPVRSDCFNPMNDANIPASLIYSRKIASRVPFLPNIEKLITQDRLGKSNSKVGPRTSQLVHDQLRKCGVNPENVAIYTRSENSISKLALGESLAATCSSLSSSDQDILFLGDDMCDKYIDRPFTFKDVNFRAVEINGQDLFKHVIAHEACHILKRDYILANILLNNQKTFKHAQKLYEFRADLYSVFQGPTPLLYARVQQTTDALPPYPHLGSFEWTKLIADLRKIGLNEESRQD